MRIQDIYKGLSISTFMGVFYRIGNSYLSKRYEGYGIGYGQHQFLITLYSENGLTQDELTKRVAVDKATTTRAINKLKEAGYVTVEVDISDKRVHIVKLTEKAIAVKEEILEIENQWEELLLEKLTEDDKKQLLELFHKIVREY